MLKMKSEQVKPFGQPFAWHALESNLQNDKRGKKQFLYIKRTKKSSKTKSVARILRNRIRMNNRPTYRRNDRKKVYMRLSVKQKKTNNAK